MGVKRSAKDIDVVPWCYVACRAPTLEEVIGIATDVFKTRLASPHVIATVDMISSSELAGYLFSNLHLLPQLQCSRVLRVSQVQVVKPWLV